MQQRVPQGDQASKPHAKALAQYACSDCWACVHVQPHSSCWLCRILVQQDARHAAPALRTCPAPLAAHLQWPPHLLVGPGTAAPAAETQAPRHHHRCPASSSGNTGWVLGQRQVQQLLLCSMKWELHGAPSWPWAASAALTMCQHTCQYTATPRVARHMQACCPPPPACQTMPPAAMPQPQPQAHQHVSAAAGILPQQRQRRAAASLAVVALCMAQVHAILHVAGATASTSRAGRSSSSSCCACSSSSCKSICSGVPVRQQLEPAAPQGRTLRHH
jgi:hypothetical protein